MAARILDPNSFILSGGITDWAAIGKAHGNTAGAIADGRKIGTSTVQLRWIMDPGLGLPSRPFQVFTRRRKSAASNGAPLVDVTRMTTVLGWSAYSWDSPVVFVRGTTSMAGPTLIAAYAGAPYQSALVGFAAVPAGVGGFRLSGPCIQSLVVMGGGDLSGLTGFVADDEANDPAWTLFETVGLPVAANGWAGPSAWADKQGMVGAPLPPADAALDRFRRGAPFYGWDDLIEPARAAPPWVLADPKMIVLTMQQDMLADLATMMNGASPASQLAFRVDRALALSGTGNTAETAFSPIATLMLAVASDPLASLVAGFGTAYTPPPEVVLGNSVLGGVQDFMVTATYDKGLNGASAPLELAAICVNAAVPLAPPQPANLQAVMGGLMTPASADLRHRAVMRLLWDQVPQATPFRVASYAAARYGIVPAAAVTPLIGPRKHDKLALQVVSATTSQQAGADTGQLRATDDTALIDPASAPNQFRYAVAHQDLFGIWSRWSATGVAAQEPDVQPVRLLAARLDAPAPAAGSIATATLTVDVSWDWTVRRPRVLRLVGRMYAAAKPGAAPADLSLPAGLPVQFPGGAGVPFAITFNGADAGAVAGGASLAYITQDAKNIQAVPVIVAGPRRYRLTVPGLQLDFAATGHVGLALWAQGQENLAPARTGAWPAAPLLVTSASDPRPPKITALHEDVELASLADARGEHRARLAWSPLAGAVGYFVYECPESKFRIAAGLGEAPQGRTLADRLLDLRNAFEAVPRREPFTRVNSTAQTATDREVVIPRGSKEIHMYLVLGTSAGQVEGAWPDAGDADRRKRFQAFAAPQVVVPSPLRLEVVRTQAMIGGVQRFRAQVAVTTRPGAAVARVDLYRVRKAEASLELDTMGPPVARIGGAGPVWQVVPATGTGPGEAQAIGRITGLDDPGGSWRRVSYRACAVAADIPSRGLYGGRSVPTGAVSLVVPPDDPPAVSAIVGDWPGGALEAVRATFTSPAPLEDSDLGPHRMRVEVFAVPASGPAMSLFTWPPPGIPAGAPPDGRLSAVPHAPGAGAALFSEAVAGTIRYRVLFKRPALADAVRVRVLLSDPLGRATERLLESPGGSPLPAPDLVGPLVTPSGPGRFILSFGTGALFTATPIGPYTLKVVLKPAPTVFSPQPASVTVTVPLPGIVPLAVFSNPFNDVSGIPLRHRRGGISVYLRSPGNVSLTLSAPDGRTGQLDLPT